jgi:hypothetical protein
MVKNRLGTWGKRSHASTFERPAKEYLASADRLVRDIMSRRPLAALGTLLAAGVILGWILKRR